MNARGTNTVLWKYDETYKKLSCLHAHGEFKNSIKKYNKTSM